MRTVSLALIVAVLQVAHAEALPREPAGMWNDGREAENHGLYLARDGSGDSISERCYSIAWTYDPRSSVLTVDFHVEPHEKPISTRLRYDPTRELLTVLDEQGRESDRTFHRADQRYIDWWLSVKAKGKK